MTAARGSQHLFQRQRGSPFHATHTPLCAMVWLLAPGTGRRRVSTSEIEHAPYTLSPALTPRVPGGSDSVRLQSLPLNRPCSFLSRPLRTLAACEQAPAALLEEETGGGAGLSPLRNFSHCCAVSRSEWGPLACAWVPLQLADRRCRRKQSCPRECGQMAHVHDCEQINNYCSQSWAVYLSSLAHLSPEKNYYLIGML